MDKLNGRHRPGTLSRELFIDGSFQLRFGFLIAGVAIFTSALTAFTVLLVRTQIAGPYAAVAGTAVALSSAILIVFVSIVISHRLVGPLFVMTGFLTKLAYGKYPPSRPIRDADQLKDFYRLFTNSMETLKAKELEELFKLQQASHVFGPLAVTPEARESLDYLKGMVERKRASLAESEEANAQVAGSAVGNLRH